MKGGNYRNTLRRSVVNIPNGCVMAFRLEFIVRQCRQGIDLYANTVYPYTHTHTHPLPPFYTLMHSHTHTHFCLFDGTAHGNATLLSHTRWIVRAITWEATHRKQELCWNNYRRHVGHLIARMWCFWRAGPVECTFISINFFFILHFGPIRSDFNGDVQATRQRISKNPSTENEETMWRRGWSQRHRSAHSFFIHVHGLYYHSWKNFTYLLWLFFLFKHFISFQTQLCVCVCVGASAGCCRYIYISPRLFLRCSSGKKREEVEREDRRNIIFLNMYI